MVDFKNLPFSFTLELNMLKDEQTRAKTGKSASFI